MTFEITGSFTLGTASGAPAQLVAADSYDCGWPRSDLAAYDGDYRVTVGGQLPGGVFQDRCGDFVELRHFLGRYLVVDISAIDCPPCQGMAQAEPAFLAQMEAEGIDVEVVTLLAPSLADTAGTPTQAELQEWTDYFHLESPVLADRFWGLGTVEPVIPDEYAYPSVVVVAPDGEVLSLSSGFGGFEAYADTIRAHRQ